MPQAAVDGISLFYERHGAGEPVLLIQGMSGTHLAWGEAFLAGLGDDLDVVAYDHRGVGELDAAGPSRSPSPSSPTTPRACSTRSGWDDAHVLGHLDGRHGRPGARAAPSAADPHADARLHVPRRGARRSCADPALIQELAGALLSGDRERALRTGFAANVSAAYVADEANWEPFQAMATALPVAVPVIMLQMQAVMGHDTSARLGAIEAPDAGRPRHRGPHAAGRQRRAHRAADPATRASSCSRASGTCSGGSSPSAARRSCAPTSWAAQ